MNLLDRFLVKSKAPFTKADLEEALTLYGPAMQLVTHRADGKIVAFAILTLPMRLLGKTISTILAAGTDGTVDARELFETVKLRARSWGADTLLAATWRNPEAITRRFGGTIDSTNLSWRLDEGEVGDGVGTRNGTALQEEGPKPKGRRRRQRRSRRVHKVPETTPDKPRILSQEQGEEIRTI